MKPDCGRPLWSTSFPPAPATPASPQASISAPIPPSNSVSGFSSNTYAQSNAPMPWFTAAANPRFQGFANRIVPALRETSCRVPSADALSTTTISASTCRKESRQAPITACELCVTTTTPRVLMSV